MRHTPRSAVQCQSERALAGRPSFLGLAAYEYDKLNVRSDRGITNHFALDAELVQCRGRYLGQGAIDEVPNARVLRLYRKFQHVTCNLGTRRWAVAVVTVR